MYKHRTSPVTEIVDKHLLKKLKINFVNISVQTKFVRFVKFRNNFVMFRNNFVIILKYHFTNARDL